MLRRADVVGAYSRMAQERAGRPVAATLLPHQPDALGGLRFLEFRLAPGDTAVGRDVRDLTLPQECILVSIRRGPRALIPHGDTRLQAGDLVVALTHPASAPALRAALGVTEQQESPPDEGPETRDRAPNG
jgi:Trk K+ transport system NAD-binding subunit